MQNGVTPELLAFILTVGLYGLVAFGIMIGGATVVYATLFWKGNISGPTIARIIHQTDLPKLATIILIVLSASLLAMMRVIAGEAVIALLSGIAGYVLGNRAAPKETPSE